mmetsp:Transcript_101960/g.314685  ORF Transcript_101960/g.314685 Transcript_101960/m.314685 type:complete len:204 (-) Transcript_101960:853-1464(-)
MLRMIFSCPDPSMFHIWCMSYSMPRSSFLLAGVGTMRSRPLMNSSTATEPFSLKSISATSSLTSGAAIWSRLSSFCTSSKRSTPSRNSSWVSLLLPSLSILRKIDSKRWTISARSCASLSVCFFGRMSMMVSTITAVTRFSKERFVNRMKTMIATAITAPTASPLPMKCRTASGKSSKVANVNSVNMDEGRLPKRLPTKVSLS